MSTLLILAGIFIGVRVLASVISPQGAGALQVTSSVKAEVFLDGESIGFAPLCKCAQNETIPSGIHSLRLVPEDNNLSEFVTKITINPNVLTAVERTFLPGGAASSYILTLEKISSENPQIIISSIPDGALVSLDGNTSGITPLELKSVTESEHEIEIQKEGFSKKTVRIRAVKFYKLNLDVILGASLENIQESSTPTTDEATTAATLVQISSTPTGFLNVRSNPSTAASIITKINPGETYPFVSESNGWFEITLIDGKNGWISARYAQKIEAP